MRAMAAGLVMAGLIGLGGCSGTDYTPVTGTILLDGEPVPEASVAFVPDDPSGEGATGYTDEDGRFTMTSSKASGVKPGRYKVRVEALAERPPVGKTMSQIMEEKMRGGGETKDANKAAATAYKQQIKDAKEANKRKRVTTPKVYNDPVNTPLRADIPATREYKFELSKDAGPVEDPAAKGKADKGKGK